jgi:amino acid adenylation domain-containing protein
MGERNEETEPSIAVVGMALRVPGARNAGEFWTNLKEGRESIRFQTKDDLLASGVDPASVDDARYVPACGFVDGVAEFDAPFFGYTPREATLMDPQQRFFLECAWEALEDAAIDPSRHGNRIGVFAGCGMSGYLLNIQSALGAATEDFLPTAIGTFADFLSTRVSYRLNLRGPSMAIQTACSTSLVAVHVAALHLLAGQCDVALAGGVTMRARKGGGYLHQEGGILSADGHCRAFDGRATGTVEGNGVGLVVLKRLDDAIADRDYIRAVIRGSAVNNDGAAKVGFTAPSVEGQADVIALAHAMAGIEPRSIGYFEAHGTGTEIGDAIEIAALTQAFARSTADRQFCALGSVKTNIGHLDTAAGVVGLIKTILALEHGQIPPSLHCESPNPKIDWEHAPVYVAKELRDWSGTAQRRAGVSSFGIGGTNAHVVLEEAPRSEPEHLPSGRFHVLTFSAKTSDARERYATRWAQHLSGTDLPVADVAATLQDGRCAFAHRRVVIAKSTEEMRSALAEQERAHVVQGVAPDSGRWLALLFPGQGSQYVDMGRGLYDAEPIFSTCVDECAAILEPKLGVDLRRLLYPAADRREEATPKLDQTRLTQPALFVVEYAMAELWSRWVPGAQAILGHSIGEYVAACRAGVFSLSDALTLVAARGELMQRCPPGAMTSVASSEAELVGRLGRGLSVAAVNGPLSSVIAGPQEDVARLERELLADGVHTTRLRTSHAFHSSMVDSILPRFAACFRGVTLRPPRHALLSNVTGQWMRPEDATDPGYWVRHLRSTVRFSDCLTRLFEKERLAILECGPGRALQTLGGRHPGRPVDVPIVASLRHAAPGEPDELAILRALGELWCEGVDFDWRSVRGARGGRRRPLPTYPFEREEYWLAPPTPVRSALSLASPNHGAAVAEPVLRSPDMGGDRRPRPHLLGQYRAPGDVIEQTLCEIFGECLGFQGIGVDDDLFELGADSLLLVQMASRLRSAFDVDLPLKQLFNQATVSAVARALRSEKEAACLTPMPSCTASSPRDESVPDEPGSVGPTVSFAQKRMWILEELARGTALYHIGSCLRLRGALDRSALAEAVRASVERQQALRTRFPAVEGEPVPVVEPPSFVRLEIVDLTREPRLPIGQARDATRKVAEERFRRRFDLEAGPLFRAELLVVAPDEHWLLLVMHHIVGDGSSMEVLARELVHFYERGRSKTQAALASLPWQYADYARWQHRHLRGQHLDELLAYWKERLRNLSPLELPIDHPRPAIQTSRGGNVKFELDARDKEAIEALSRSERVTPFMVLLAALALFLGRHGESEDVAIGSPIAGRTRSELEGIIGLFVNTIVLRLDLGGDPTVSAFLARVREATIDAYQHQELPFEQLLDGLRVAREPSRTPIFQVMLSYEGESIALPEIEGVEVTRLPLDTETAEFDLTLVVGAERSGYACKFEYNRDLFEEATIRRMVERFRILLRDMVSDPQQRVHHIALTTSAERRELLELARGASVNLGGPNVIDLIGRWAERQPHAPAVEGGDAVLRYGELWGEMERLGARLRGVGAGPEVLVGLLTERSPSWIVGMLAILGAGAAFVPVDPALPDERLRAILDDGGVKIVLTTRRLRHRAPAGCRVLLADDLDELAVRGKWAARPDFDCAAYTVYTSGSTGVPKGVVVTHRSLLNHARAISQAYELGPQDRVLQFASMAFDVAIEEVFPTLASGATVVLAAEETLAEVSQFVLALERAAITVVNLPTPFWQTWVSELGLANELQPPPALRLLVVGSHEASTNALNDWLRRIDRPLRWVNAYGPSEATVTSLIYDLDATWNSTRARVPIGRPIANVNAHVLDADLEPCGRGVPGELYIGGAAPARGYLRRPDLTAQAFIPDPFGEAGARLYRTGDRVRLNDHGELEFLGRRDRQVKIRGYRVELEEIETTLSRIPGVADAAVLARTGADGERRLEAHVATEGDSRWDAASLRARLARTLSHYMVPPAWRFYERLPRTADGKLDRHALDEAVAPRRYSARAPETPEQEALLGIWREILGLESVGILDNFFELGGDSLSAMRLIARARRAGLTFTLQDLFQHQSVAGIAAVMSTTDAPRDNLRSTTTGEIPLTAAQLALFELEPAGPSHWNRSLLLETDHVLELPLLDAAVAELVNRHDALRARFTLGPRGWHQEIDGSVDASEIVTYHDLSSLPTELRIPAMESAAEALQRSFDLGRPPLLRIALFALQAEGPGRLLVVLHGLVSDGLSWAVILEELQAAYRQLEEGQPSVLLPPPTSSFADAAREVAALADRPAAREHLAQRQSVLAGAIHPPHDHDLGPNIESSQRVVRARSPAAVSEALLRGIPLAWDVRTEDILLAALASTLGAWMGGVPVWVDLGRHGRKLPHGRLDMTRVVGSFVTDCPIALEPPPSEARQAALHMHRALNALDAPGWTQSPRLDRGADANALARHAAIPRPAISFDYLGRQESALPVGFRLARESAGTDRSPTTRRSHELQIVIGVTDSVLSSQWRYSDSLHRRETMDALATRFHQHLDDLYTAFDGQSKK